jgi:VWFA-related protein
MPTRVRGQVQLPGAVALTAVLVSAALVPGDAAQEPPPSEQGQPTGPRQPGGRTERTDQGQAPAQGQPTFRVEANFVRVDVYPTADGKPVQGLTAADFEVLEDGVPQKIETFEHVIVRGNLPQEVRREPNTIREGRALAEDGRARVFVVFLDTYHTEISGSHRMQSAIVDLLDHVIGPDDLFAVMTPEMSVSDLALARRTTTTAAMLSKYWYWGKRDRLADRDPVEYEYEACYPEQGVATKCRDVASPTGEAISQPDNFYAGVAREMILRRREKRVLDALTDLTVYLRGVREERKAVLAISDGWALFRPNRNLRRMAPCDPPPDMGRIGTDPRGRVTTDEQQAYGSFSRATCERDRMNLAELDNWQTFMDLFDGANRSNVSFYPIDSRGLPASDAPIYEDVPPALDQSILSARIETLRSLAINTDGVAIVNSNDIERGMRRIIDDLTSYYLLGYYSSNAKLDGRFRAIKVRVKRPGLDVRARRGYRSISEKELHEGQAQMTAAQAAAPPSTLQLALASLAGVRPEISLRTDVSWVAAPLDDAIPGAKSHVWVVGEIAAVSASSVEWANGGEAQVLLTAEDGVKLSDVTQPIPPAARSVSVQLPDVPLAPGEFTLRLRLKPSGGGLPFQDTFRFTVPDETTAVGRARILRSGPATGNQYAPTADPRFRRTDRVRVDVPILGTLDRVTAEVLDRNGKTLQLPVESTRRDDPEPSLHWASAEVSLAPLAPGDYLVKTTVQQGSQTSESLTAFRVIP